MKIAALAPLVHPLRVRRLSSRAHRAPAPPVAALKTTLDCLPAAQLDGELGEAGDVQPQILDHLTRDVGVEEGPSRQIAFGVQAARGRGSTVASGICPA